MDKAIAVGLALLVLLPAIASPVFASSSSSSACGQANPDNNILFGGYCVTPRNSYETISGATMSFKLPYTTCAGGACGSLAIFMAGLAGTGCDLGDLSTLSKCAVIAGVARLSDTYNSGLDDFSPPCASCGNYESPANPGDQIKMVVSTVPGGYSVTVYDLTNGVTGSATSALASPLAGIFFGVTVINSCGNCPGPEPLPEFGQLTLHAQVTVGNHVVPLEAMETTEFVLVGFFTGGITAQPTRVTGDSFGIIQLSTEI